VRCADCGGSGAAPGTEPITCLECAGTGQVRRVRQSLLGQMVTAGPCPRCNGSGQIVPTPCPTCRGEGRTVEERTYNVDVPAGVDTGSTLRLTGRGAAGPRGGPAGDLYVHLRVQPHERFERAGYDLVTEMPISFAQAALGTHLELETLDGAEEIVVAAGTQSGRELRLRGRGVPHVEGRGRGDVRVVLRVDTPTKLSASEQELLRSLAEERGEVVDAPAVGVFSRIKSAFK
jgi:molecular chaperone DnaJ